MANLKPPPKEEVAAKAAPIADQVAAAKPIKPTEQTPPDAIKPLQLKIPESKRNEFKAFAAMRGKSMNTLFIEMFEEYKKQ